MQYHTYTTFKCLQAHTLEELKTLIPTPCTTRRPTPSSPYSMDYITVYTIAYIVAPRVFDVESRVEEVFSVIVFIGNYYKTLFLLCFCFF